MDVMRLGYILAQGRTTIYNGNTRGYGALISNLVGKYFFVYGGLYSGLFLFGGLEVTQLIFTCGAIAGLRGRKAIGASGLAIASNPTSCATGGMASTFI